MNYSPDNFLRLMDEAERQGGAHSSDVCKPQNYKLKMPVPGNPSKRKWRNYTTTGCGSEARFLIPYDPSKPVTVQHKGVTTEDRPTESSRAAMNERGAGMAVVCAVDDAMGLWPRFAHVIQEDD